MKKSSNIPIGDPVQTPVDLQALFDAYLSGNGMPKLMEFIKENTISEKKDPWNDWVLMHLYAIYQLATRPENTGQAVRVDNRGQRRKLSIDHLNLMWDGYHSLNQMEEK